MAEQDGAAGLSDLPRFQARVWEDAALRARLRPPMEREAYVAHVVAEGSACGFAFTTAEVWAALREGERSWLTQSCPVL